MSISSVSIAAAGMQAASARINASAATIAAHTAATATDQIPQTPAREPAQDVTAALVDLIDAKFQFKANAMVARAASDMEKAGIDILA